MIFSSSILVFICLFEMVNTLNKTSDCKCRLPISSRIVGGKRALLNSFPWQVTINEKLFEIKKTNDHRELIKNILLYTSSCGGTLLNERWILTAAHCVYGIRKEILEIGYGSNDLVGIFLKQKLDVEDIIYYNEDSFLNNIIYDHDICLIKLKKPLKFDLHLQPACLESSLEDKLYNELVIVGFGHDKKLIEKPDLIKSTRFLKRISILDISNKNHICSGKKNLICTISKQANQSVCFGDSGNSAINFKRGKSYAVGVLSFIRKKKEINSNKYYFCNDNAYLIKISFYLDWIKKYISEDQLCF